MATQERFTRLQDIIIKENERWKSRNRLAGYRRKLIRFELITPFLATRPRLRRATPGFKTRFIKVPKTSDNVYYVRLEGLQNLVFMDPAKNRSFTKSLLFK